MRLTEEVQIEKFKDIKFKIFSNNIIIARKVSEEREQSVKDIRSLLMCVGHFQELAASDSVSWMLRGGITIGKLFIDDIIVNEIVSNQHLSDYVQQDFDGLYYLNYDTTSVFGRERI